MRSYDELRAYWEARRQDGQRLGAMVQLEKVAQEILDAICELRESKDGEVLTLKEAAEETGYNPDSIARLIRKGKVKNLGSKHRPRVARGELTTVVGARSHAKQTTARPSKPALHSSEAAEIARDAIAGRIGRPPQQSA